MPASEGLHGYGTTFAGAGFGAFGQVRSIEVDGFEVNDIDISTMSSPGKWLEFLPGMKSSGQVTLELVYLDTVAQSVFANIAVVDTYTMTLPDGATLVFPGYIKSANLPVPFDDRVSQTVVIKIAGEPIFTPAVAS